MIISSAAVPGLILMVLLALVVLYDGLTYRIPNWLNGLIAVMFVLAHLQNWDRMFWANHIGAAALVFVVGIVFFRFRWLGGGDVKLIGACALWTGFAQLPELIVYGALAGGALALAILLCRRVNALMGPAMPGWLRGGALAMLDPERGLPYGLAIAFGALIALRPWVPLLGV